MKKQDFTEVFLVKQSPEEIFKAMINVRDWWSGYYSEKIEGGTEKLDDEFTFHAGDGIHYSKQKLIEVIPDKKIVWLVTESNLSFLEKTDEWTNTKIIFEISSKGDKNQLKFTHEGLSPGVECYNACAPAWSQYLQNKLLPLIKKTK